MLKKISLLLLSILFLFSCGGEPELSEAGRLYELNRVKIMSVVRALVFRNLAYKGFRAGTEQVHIYDFDHTLADTTITIPVSTADGSDKEIDSKCMTLNKGDKPDFTVFTRDALRDTRPIDSTLKRFEKSVADEKTLTVVLTARSGLHNFTSIYEYMAYRAGEPDLVIPVNSEFLWKNLWGDLKLLPSQKKMPKGVKKPLLIAAIIELAAQNNSENHISGVEYHEDSDSYYRHALLFIPERFSKTEVKWFDYYRTTGRVNSYREMPFAYSENGRTFHADGTEFTEEEIKNYRSDDCE